MSVHDERPLPASASEASLPELHRTVALPVAGNWFRRLFAFAGPAYLVSVGYMDPGNWATDLAGGARFGYQLVWVLLMSNLMAVLLQTLSARLGVVTGKDLAQACRDYYPGWHGGAAVAPVRDRHHRLRSRRGAGRRDRPQAAVRRPAPVGRADHRARRAAAARALAARHAAHGGVHRRARRHHRRVLRDRDVAVASPDRRRSCRGSCRATRTVGLTLFGALAERAHRAGSRRRVALHRHGHPRRHRHAAQPLPAQLAGAEPRGRALGSRASARRAA